MEIIGVIQLLDEFAAGNDVEQLASGTDPKNRHPAFEDRFAKRNIKMRTHPVHHSFRVSGLPVICRIIITSADQKNSICQIQQRFYIFHLLNGGNKHRNGSGIADPLNILADDNIVFPALDHINSQIDENNRFFTHSHAPMHSGRSCRSVRYKYLPPDDRGNRSGDSSS